MADKTRNDDFGDAELDALFSEARAQRPGADLTERVLADAASVQAASGQSTHDVIAGTRTARGWTTPGWVAAFGGWGGFGGVTAAGLVGLAVGFWSPDTVDILSGGHFPSFFSGGLGPDLSELALEAGDV